MSCRSDCTGLLAGRQWACMGHAMNACQTSAMTWLNFSHAAQSACWSSACNAADPAAQAVSVKACMKQLWHGVHGDLSVSRHQHDLLWACRSRIESIAITCEHVPCQMPHAFQETFYETSQRTASLPTKYSSRIGDYQGLEHELDMKRFNHF